MAAERRESREPHERKGHRSSATGERAPEGDLTAILQHNLSRIDELAETVAREAANNGLTASQLRNFYGPITKVRIDSNPTRQRAALKMHRSRLAYLVARSGGKADELWRWFGDLLRRANDPTEISGVCDFAEAIVAYHRYYDKTKGGTRDE